MSIWSSRWWNICLKPQVFGTWQLFDLFFCSSNLKPGKEWLLWGRKLSHVCHVDALGYCHFTHMMQSCCWVKSMSCLQLGIYFEDKQRERERAYVAYANSNVTRKKHATVNMPLRYTPVSSQYPDNKTEIRSVRPLICFQSILAYIAMKSHKIYIQVE